jgi:hypothetical protein
MPIILKAFGANTEEFLKPAGSRTKWFVKVAGVGISRGFQKPIHIVTSGFRKVI